MTPLRLCLRLMLAAAVFSAGARTKVFTADDAVADALQVVDLRCDWAVDPVGIDSAPPRLSWKISDNARGVKQQAWQVLVATSRAELAADHGDVWDSGRVHGDAQVHVAYGGRALRSSEQVFWKVRVWASTVAELEKTPARASSWSDVGTWTMGVLRPEEWTGRWISHPAWLAINRTQLGYRSADAADVQTPKWLQLDLGAAHPIDEVRLHALRHTVAERLGFPRKFRVEVAADAGFADKRVLADFTEKPAENWRTQHVLPAGGLSARFVRIVVPELRKLNGVVCLAFDQIEVIAGGRNVAVGAAVTASDSVEDGPWSAGSVVDGKGGPGKNPLLTETVLLRREFSVRSPLRRAVVHGCGLGHYVMAINGARVGDAFLSPGWTDTTKTCLYDSFDVTSLLREGDNAIGLTLAGGMFNVPDAGGRYSKFVGRYRPLRALVQLELQYADGSTERVVSDESWSAHAGATTYSHVFGGEDYDAGREPRGWKQPGFAPRDWESAAVAEAPGGVLRGASHAAPPLGHFDTFAPVGVKEIRPGISVYDLGQNASLTIELTAHGPCGSSVRVTPAELINDDGTISRDSVGNGPAWWQFTLAGNGGDESWRPDFFYHGSRYLQVELRPAVEGGTVPSVTRLVGRAMHTRSSPAGEFACSSELFNRTRTLIRWAQRSNLVSLITDCPHRERFGWLEQYHLNGPALRYEFDLTRLFAKTFGDMADAQTTDGLVPDIAPEFVVFEGGFRDSPEWGSALILSIWQHYLFTGDDTVLSRFYIPMRRYLDYLGTRAKDHVVDHGLGDWYDLGPGRPGFSQLTPIAVTATSIYCEDAQVLAAIARVLGKMEDAVAFTTRAAEIKTAFNAKFFDATRGSYATGSQTANAMPYVNGMAPDGRAGDVLTAIVADVRAHRDAFTAGDVGHRYLLRALADGGRSDVIFAMHHQSDRLGYGFQLARGATSLTEAWDAGRSSSQNHFMLGHITEWFYRDLAGIAPDPGAPGFKNVIIRPQPVGDITWVEASHESPYGRVAVRWERGDAQFRLRVTVPANATATVFVPAREGAAVREGTGPAERSAGVRWLRRDGDRMVYAVGSGRYEFESEMASE